MGTHEDEILEVGLRFCFTKVDGQKLVISLHSNENSFDKNYEISSAGKTSESCLNGLSSIIKKAQQETNQKLTEIVETKSLEKLDKKVCDNGDHEANLEPTLKRVKNNSK